MYVHRLVTLKLTRIVSLSTISGTWFRKFISSLMKLGTNLLKCFKIISRKLHDCWVLGFGPATEGRDFGPGALGISHYFAGIAAFFSSTLWQSAAQQNRKCCERQHIKRTGYFLLEIKSNIFYRSYPTKEDTATKLIHHSKFWSWCKKKHPTIPIGG